MRLNTVVAIFYVLYNFESNSPGRVVIYLSS